MESGYTPSANLDIATKTYVDNNSGGDDLGNHTATQDLDMANNAIDRATSIGGQTTTSNSDEWIAFSSTDITYNASSSHSWSIGGGTVLTLNSSELQINAAQLDLVTGNIQRVGDIALDSISKDGTGSITVNDAVSTSGNILMNGNQINMGGGRIVNLDNPTGESDDHAATKGYVDNAVSDPGLKQNMEPLTSALDKLRNVDVVTFQWGIGADTDSTRIGLDAETVQEHFPTSVRAEDLIIDGTLHDGVLRYQRDDLFAATVRAVQELGDQVDALNERLDNIRGRL